MKVLIAEDDPISAQVLQSYLEKWGHAVVAAENGADAWRLFQHEEISLVITDWVMPEMDGLELVRRIRSCQRDGYVYVILLTAKARKEDIVRGMEAGADDFLTKPFDREELRVRLRAGERIVQLEQSLARRNHELQQAHAQILAAHKRLRRDLEVAAKVQRSLLPTAVPECPGAHFAWMFLPCEELAGDLLGDVNIYDVEELFWAVATRADPHTDVVTLPGPRKSPLDPTPVLEHPHACLIDATVPGGPAYREDFLRARPKGYGRVGLRDFLQAAGP